MNMAYCGLLLVTPLLSSCGQKTSRSEVDLPPKRLVATVYALKTHTSDIACYRLPISNAPIVTHMHNQQQVKLVTSSNQLIQQDTEYWLHIYPSSHQDPACYLNIRNLVPVS